MTTIVVLFILILYIILALDILNIIANWIVYKKVGRKGWESLIPFYNFWILAIKVANLNWWWMLICFSPFIALFLYYLGIQSIIMILISLVLCYISSFVCFYNIAKKFNHNTIDAIGMLLIPNIMFPIMAFSKNWIYDENIIVNKNGPFKNK